MGPNYPTIELITVDGKPYIQAMREKDIKAYLSEQSYKLFNDFMRGQTIPIFPDNGEKGVYPWDFERFLRGYAKH